jgi:hypothetical protein
VPAIFTIENGSKVLNQNELKPAGISVFNTKYEKYQQNVAELRNYGLTRNSSR